MPLCSAHLLVGEYLVSAPLRRAARHPAPARGVERAIDGSEFVGGLREHEVQDYAVGRVCERDDSGRAVREGPERLRGLPVGNAAGPGGIERGVQLVGLARDAGGLDTFEASDTNVHRDSSHQPARPAARMLSVTTANVSASASLGLNSTTSKSADTTGVCPGGA